MWWLTIRFGHVRRMSRFWTWVLNFMCHRCCEGDILPAETSPITIVSHFHDVDTDPVKGTNRLSLSPNQYWKPFWDLPSQSGLYDSKQIQVSLHLDVMGYFSGPFSLSGLVIIPTEALNAPTKDVWFRCFVSIQCSQQIFQMQGAAVLICHSWAQLDWDHSAGSTTEHLLSQWEYAERWCERLVPSCESHLSECALCRRIAVRWMMTWISSGIVEMTSAFKPASRISSYLVVW